MIDVGIDLAWGPNGRTGLAAVDASGRLVALAGASTDDQIAVWLDSLAPLGPMRTIGVDAPIVVPNESGRREGERLIAEAYARFHAGPHPTNRSTRYMDPPRALTLARRFGWTIDPVFGGVADGSARPQCLEVYPHPGMVGLFRLDRVLPYKRGAFPERHAAFLRLLGLLETIPELRLGASADWAGVRRRVAGAARLVDLDRVEDEIDAVFCAHLAWLWRERPGALAVYGDATAGYVVAPPPAAEIGVGPWPGARPDDPRLDAELLEHGDARNVVDRYRYWSVEAITADLDRRRHPFAVAIENWQHDLNIGSIVRTANAFLASEVHVVGRRRWNRRGAMVTERYQHVEHHEDVAGLVAWAAERDLPIVAVDNVPGAVDVRAAELPERCVLLFGQEGPGLSAPALAAAALVVAIPQWGSTRSINAAAAAAIVMHEWIRRWAD